MVFISDGITNSSRAIAIVVVRPKHSSTMFFCTSLWVASKMSWIVWKVSVQAALKLSVGQFHSVVCHLFPFCARFNNVWQPTLINLWELLCHRSKVYLNGMNSGSNIDDSAGAGAVATEGFPAELKYCSSDV